MTRMETTNGAVPRRNAAVISVGMQKGGVAKTTTTLHIAGALAARGRRVLVWDVDENYGATKVFGLAERSSPRTMDVVTGDASIESAILSSDSDPGLTLPPSLHFIPSSRALQGLERAFGATGRVGGPGNCLAPHIASLRALERYDYIFIDTGPHASACTRSSYLVSDYFILSVTPEKQAIASLPDALQDILNAKRHDRNPTLQLLGLVVACLDRRILLQRYYERAIEEGFLDSKGGRVKFKTTIGIAAAIDRAYKENRLLVDVDPRHRVSKQFFALADEVEHRIAARRKPPAEVAAGEEVRVYG